MGLNICDDHYDYNSGGLTYDNTHGGCPACDIEHDLNEAKSLIYDLAQDLDADEGDYDSLREAISELVGDELISDLKEKIEELEAELSVKVEEMTSLENDVTSLEKEIESFSKLHQTQRVSL